jgi:predicted kinase
MLWREFGLCGSAEKRNLREAVCTLVEYHSFPPYSLIHKDEKLRLLKTASIGKLVPDFSLKLLYILAKADALGRKSDDQKDQLERVELFKLSAKEAGCFEKPWEFANDFSEIAFYKGKTLWKEQELFDDTTFEVILLSGLPGTGKDYWIEKNCGGLPVISLDDIRKKLKISPLDNQGKVIACAHEKAREYLRKKQDFVWNATNVTALTRAKQISLFEKYGASVKTVFLETEWSEQLRRNASRKDSVPVGVICKLLAKTEPPKPFECENVIWETV